MGGMLFDGQYVVWGWVVCHLGQVVCHLMGCAVGWAVGCLGWTVGHFETGGLLFEGKMGMLINKYH